MRSTHTMNKGLPFSLTQLINRLPEASNVCKHRVLNMGRDSVKPR
jgi:hypothetical protein